MGNGTHKSQITTWAHRLNETAYGVARANSADTRRIISNDQTVIDVDTAFENDAGYDNGSDVASDMWAITNDTGVSIPLDFNFSDIGYFLLDILGGYTVDAAASPTFLHYFTPQNVNISRQMPSRTYFKKYGGLKIVMLVGGVLTGLTISGGKVGRLKASATVKGSKIEENPSGYTEPAIEDDREYGYAQQASFAVEDETVGVAQVETATVAGTISGAGNVSVVVTASGLTGSPLTIPVAVANLDTAAQVAGKIRTALAANAAVASMFSVGGTGTAVVLTKLTEVANDATLNVALATGTATGLTTAATSANTTAGVLGDKQSYSCDIEDWTLSLNNPEADDGFTACSEYLVDGNPKSGAVRSEHLVGARDYTFDFTAKLQASDKMRGYLKAGKNVSLLLKIAGVDTAGNDIPFDLSIFHTKARVVEAKEQIVGNWIGVKGKVQLLSASGAIPLTAALQNDVASYTS